MLKQQHQTLFKLEPTEEKQKYIHDRNISHFQNDSSDPF